MLCSKRILLRLNQTLLRARQPGFHVLPGCVPGADFQRTLSRIHAQRRIAHFLLPFKQEVQPLVSRFRAVKGFGKLLRPLRFPAALLVGLARRLLLRFLPHKRHAVALDLRTQLFCAAYLIGRPTPRHLLLPLPQRRVAFAIKSSQLLLIGIKSIGAEDIAQNLLLFSGFSGQKALELALRQHHDLHKLAVPHADDAVGGLLLRGGLGIFRKISFFAGLFQRQRAAFQRVVLAHIVLRLLLAAAQRTQPAPEAIPPPADREGEIHQRFGLRIGHLAAQLVNSAALG